MAKMYSKFADAHARILERYATFGDSVPTQIVSEHAGTIRHEIEQAEMAMSWLAEAEKDKPSIALLTHKTPESPTKLRESVTQLEVELERAVHTAHLKDTLPERRPPTTQRN
jgi:hypothetical protein